MEFKKYRPKMKEKEISAFIVPKDWTVAIGKNKKAKEGEVITKVWIGNKIIYEVMDKKEFDGIYEVVQQNNQP